MRSQTIFILTRCSMFIFIEIGPGKAGRWRIISLRHWDVITKLNVPTIRISSFTRLIIESSIWICLFLPFHLFSNTSLNCLKVIYIKTLNSLTYILSIFDFSTNWLYWPSINSTHLSRIVCLSLSCDSISNSGYEIFCILISLNRFA